MLRILKFLFVLALIGFAGLAIFSYFGDLGPTRADVTKPVELNVER